jgi:hypothetical protein
MALLRMRASEQEALAAGLHLFDDVSGDDGIPMSAEAAAAALAKGVSALNAKGYESGVSVGGGVSGGRQSPALSRASSMRVQDIALDV